jgi:isopentenyldiphosphate isomerase
MDETTWAVLVQRVAALDHALTAEVVRELLTLSSSPTPSGASSAFEYLLPLDVQGAPLPLPGVLIDRVRDMRASAGEFGAWFCPVPLTTKAGDDRETLLVARWLHHRLGLRHRTVQLILDHPTQPAMTFIQVRGLDKAEAPGAFDMPCAGHVVGLDSAFMTLDKELGEELGLTLDDLDDLRHVGDYEYPPDGTALDLSVDFHNVEYRTIYRARLRTGALARVRFADNEVVALAMVPQSILLDLVARFPDRIASGLHGMLSWYRVQSTGLATGVKCS